MLVLPFFFGLLTFYIFYHLFDKWKKIYPLILPEIQQACDILCSAATKS